jgi:N-acyl-D-amino-acid deacylase
MQEPPTRAAAAAAACLALGCGLARMAPSGDGYDLVLSGGRVVDGTGAPWFRGDVGIRGDRIAAVGDLSSAPAARRIDASGLTVAPGFFDMLGQSETNLLIDNRVESKIRQGITSEITGEGGSVAPQTPLLIAEQRPYLDKYHLSIDWTDLPGYQARFARSRSTINLGTFVGAAQVRGALLGLGDVQPTPAQLAQMVEEVERQMDAGALGLSSALIYQPGSYAQTAELIALASAAARKGGIYATHLRSEGAHLLDAGLDEAFRIAREARIPVEIWHFKASGVSNWPLQREAIERIEKARAAGLDVTADVYPYVASANGLDATIPGWAHAGGTEAMIARIRDPAQRPRIVAEVRKDLVQGSGPERLLLLSAGAPALQGYMGRTLDQVARKRGQSPEEALVDLVAEDRGSTWVARFGMSEENVQLVLRQPWVSLCTDYPGQAVDGAFAADRAHPRAFGSMARVLGLYVRDAHLFPLEEAVRKMTSLPAQRVGLYDRGLVRPGMMADLTVFDAAAVRDVATFDSPNRYAEGIRWVVVNGEVVLDDGALTAARPGRFLRPSRARP